MAIKNGRGYTVMWKCSLSLKTWQWSRLDYASGRMDEGQTRTRIDRNHRRGYWMETEKIT